jgi:cytochrome P450
MILINLPAALWRWLTMVLEGLWAIVWLAAVLIPKAFSKGGVGSAATSPDVQRQGFALLRAFQPNLSLSQVLVKSYPNTGTTIVSRRVDVREVLERDDVFEVVYKPRMEMITGGANFFLGMQDSADYSRDTTNMRMAMRRTDLPAIVQPFVAKAAGDIVAAAPGVIDVPETLALPVAARLLDAYFGLPGPSEAEMIDWTTTLFWYLFIDLGADPTLDAKAAAAAASLRAYIDGAIAARKASGAAKDDILGRCLALQAEGAPGMDDLGIRNNMIGLLIGELPTTSCAAVRALDQLLARPAALASAQAAARAGNADAVAQHVYEGLRFAPVNPVIYRRAAQDTWVADGTLRARHIKAGTMVMASNLSAMFDPLDLPSPNAFRADRPWDAYMLWGFGLHTCFGDHLNRVTLPGLLTPLLTQPNLRRAPGPTGQIDTGGTPFPVHFNVAWG